MAGSLEEPKIVPPDDAAPHHSWSRTAQVGALARQRDWRIERGASSLTSSTLHLSRFTLHAT